jgi:(p)ppGpp synthase/HD superfamily hydrolase
MAEDFKAFMQRMEMFFPHNQAVQASVFYKLIKNEFRSFKRKSQTDELGNPLRYFEHLRGTALILIDEVALIDFITIMAAIGHDAIEDTRMPLEEVTLVCGPEVSKTIALCSKCPKEGFFKRLCLHGTWRVLMVKFADRIYNLRTLGDNRDFMQKQYDETTREFVHLKSLLRKLTPAEYDECAVRIIQLLDEEIQNVRLKLRAP